MLGHPIIERFETSPPPGSQQHTDFELSSFLLRLVAVYVALFEAALPTFGIWINTLTEAAELDDMSESLT